MRSGKLKIQTEMLKVKEKLTWQMTMAHTIKRNLKAANEGIIPD